MWPRSQLYPLVLAGAHRVIFHMTSTDVYGNPLTVDDEGNPQLLNIDYSGGSVSANLTNRVTRRASFNVPEALYPLVPSDPMSEEAAVITITGGLLYGDGTEEVFPLIKGRVQNAERDDAGVVTIQVEDFAADVIAYRFEQLWKVKNPGSVLAEIQAVILDAFPQATFTAGDTDDAPVPVDLAFDEDRGKALDDLAQAVGGRWYALGDGSFTVRKLPYQDAPAVVDLVDGDNGMISRARVRRSRDGRANSVTVLSERTDGTNPVRATARDLIGSSPTKFAGPFGKVSQVIKVQTPLTQAQAGVFARAQLEASLALGQQWTMDTVPDYSLEPADVARVQSRSLVDKQVIDSITYPLGADGVQTIQGRSMVDPAVTLIE